MEKGKKASLKETHAPDEKLCTLKKIMGYYLADMKASAISDLDLWISQKVKECKFMVTTEAVRGMIDDYEKHRSEIHPAPVKSAPEPVTTEIIPEPLKSDDVSISDGPIVPKKDIRDRLFEMLTKEKLLQIDLARAANFRIEYLSWMKKDETMGKVPEEIWHLILKVIRSGKKLREYFTIIQVEKGTKSPRTIKDKPVVEKKVIRDKGKQATQEKVSEIKEKRPKIKKQHLSESTKQLLAKIRERLQKAMDDEGLNQKQIAEHFGIKQPYICMILSKKKPAWAIPIYVIKVLSEWMDMNIKISEYQIKDEDERVIDPVLTEKAKEELLLQIEKKYEADLREGSVSNIDSWCIEETRKQPGLTFEEIKECVIQWIHDEDYRNFNPLPIENKVLADSPEFKAAFDKALNESKLSKNLKILSQALLTLSDGFTQGYNTTKLNYQKAINDISIVAKTGDLDQRDKSARPPDGIYPRFLWLEDRQKELEAAIERYLKAGKEPDPQWYVEYNDISVQLLTLKRPDPAANIPKIDVDKPDGSKAKREFDFSSGFDYPRKNAIIDNNGGSRPLYKEKKPGFFRRLFGMK